MLRKCLAFVIVFALFSSEKGMAQNKKKAKKPSPPHQVVIDSSIKGDFNFEVSVRLSNGGLMYGVVLRGILFEKMKKRDFIAVKDWKEKRAGLRLWYVNDQKGYVFIPYSDILEVSRVRILSEEAMKRLFDRLLQKEKEAREARKAASKKLEEEKLAKKEEEGDKEEEEKKKKKSEEESKMKEIIDAKLALFKKFHPDKGWTPEKKKYIKWRGPVIGVYPNEEEKEFLDNYDDWYVIYKKWKEEQDKEGGEEKKDEKEALEDKGDQKGEEKENSEGKNPPEGSDK